MGKEFKPVELVKGKIKGTCLHAIDLKGWLEAGYEVVETKGGAKAPVNDGLDGLSDDALLALAKQKKVEVKDLTRPQIIAKLRG